MDTQEQIVELMSLSPSGASRWLHCMGSPRYILDNQDRVVEKTHEVTDEGKRAHELAESMLKGVDAKEEYPSDMRSHMVDYVAYCKALAGDNEYGTEALYKLPHQKTRHAVVDFWTFDKATGTLKICDLKYGYSFVGAEQNPQMMMYAATLITHEYEKLKGLKAVEMHIYQPRIDNFSSWSVSIGTFFDLYQEIQGTIDLIKIRSNLPLTPSQEACKYCPANSFCGTRARAIQGRAFGEGFDELTPEEIGCYVANSDIIAQWIKDLSNYALEAVKTGRGELVGGMFELGVGRQGNTQWANEELAIQASASILGDEAYTTKPKTPTQILKLLKEKGVDEGVVEVMMANTYRPEGKEKLVLKGERPELNATSNAADLSEFSAL